MPESPIRTLADAQAAATEATYNTARAHVVFRYTDRTDGARLLRFGFVTLAEWRAESPNGKDTDGRSIVYAGHAVYAAPETLHGPEDWT